MDKLWFHLAFLMLGLENNPILEKQELCCGMSYIAPLFFLMAKCDLVPIQAASVFVQSPIGNRQSFQSSIQPCDME